MRTKPSAATSPVRSVFRFVFFLFLFYLFVFPVLFPAYIKRRPLGSHICFMCELTR